MIAIGMGLVWAGYTGVLWGVFLITGKNVGLAQLMGSTWPPQVPSANLGGAAGAPGSTGTGTGGGGSKGSPVVKLNNGRRIVGSA
jgi:hypothetical protein